MSKESQSPWAIRPLVPQAVYTDRQEHIDYLYTCALKAITRRSMSTVLLGQRRMGKTEIFKRVVNRLFFDQDNPQDPDHSVVPVYFSFPDTVVDKWVFCTKYVENFLRWYVAFRLQDIDILSKESVRPEALLDVIHQKLEVTPGVQAAVNVYSALLERDLTLPEEWAIWLPRRVSDRDESTIAMFLDEFQNTRLPQYDFDVVGFMQKAVESPTCPHFVTGSAMSILTGEILGRGAVFGRFRSKPIGPMTEYWGSELALRCARYYRAEVSQEMAPVIAARCGGNPFYITAVIQQSLEQDTLLQDEQTLNEVLAVDLSSGFIWGELNDQVERWIERINEHGITKWILYLSALEEGESIDLGRIQRELKERDGQEVSVETIRDVLVKLSRGDLLEYSELGGWFRKVEDPILVDFLKVWGRMAVEGRGPAQVQDDIRLRYRSLKRQIHDHLGYLGEVYMAQILWQSQNKTLPGKYLHTEKDVVVNWHFSYIHHRVRLGAAKDMEVDVYAAAGAEVWLGESKWWQGRKAGVPEVESLLTKGRMVRSNLGEGLEVLRLWIFAHDGFTEEAKELMAKNQVLWSDREDLNALLAYVGLKTLPDISE